MNRFSVCGFEGMWKDNARVAQLVEYDLAKVGVAGSSPVSRSQEYGFRVIRDPLFVCINEITESFYLKTPRGCSLWGFCFAIWKFSHSLVAYIIFYFCHVVNMS